MNILKVELQNCFGIQDMRHEFDFSKNNVIAIYAKNGLMKTSFAKTFQKIQLSKTSEICDAIFGDTGKVTVTIDGNEITKDDVFVIKSFENSYESDITSLLVRDAVKEQLSEVLEARNKLLKGLEKSSGLKIKKKSGGKSVYEIENTIIEDFGFSETSILMNLTELKKETKKTKYGNILYPVLFDPSVLSKIKSQEFQKQIKAFILSSNHVYDSFSYLKKGQLTLPKLKDIRKSLEKDCFFVRNNQLVLAGVDYVKNTEELANKITEIESAIKKIPELKTIETMLSDAKGITLKDIIETQPDIVEFLRTDQLPLLRRELWLSYINENRELFDDLYIKYCSLSHKIAEIAIDDTPWKQALDIFSKRFTVPYSMEVSNLKGSIIGESIPQIKFSFNRGDRIRSIDRVKLDELDTLSQGEKRALYLLNIIFDIEQIRAMGREKLFIIDDIADSFDYKNKYAIIEYLYELANEDRFYLIILSHNFDFYRTISTRLSIKRENRLTANTDGRKIEIMQEHYQNQPFEYWKNNPDKKNVIALIPYSRNLIEYGCDKNVSNTQSDYLFLTNLLHQKTNTNRIKFKEIIKIYEIYIGVKKFNAEICLDDYIVDSMYSICDSLNETHTLLEDKIILAMAIRLKAEEFMLKHIVEFQGEITWKAERRTSSGLTSQFLAELEGMRNQTRELLNAYSQFGQPTSISILNEVNIMTPENIHLNSFMYEPLLDMDVIELLELYRRVKTI